MSNNILIILSMLGSVTTTILYGSLAISSFFIYIRGRNKLSTTVLKHITFIGALSLYYVVLEISWIFNENVKSIGHASDIYWIMFEICAYFVIKGSIKRIDNCLVKYGSCYHSLFKP